MAQITCRYFSDVLGMSMTASVILPQAVNHQIGMASAPAPTALPTLYLLHGLSDDDSVWLRRTSIERYVADRSLAVVMPNVHRSFYCDQVDGYGYFTHLVDELPHVMGSFFPLSSRREDTFIAGLSMGGYGAFKAALTRPHQYAAAASLSGALDGVNSPEWPDEYRRSFGTREHTRLGPNDLVHLVRTADPTALPALKAWCGTEDFLLSQNRTFVQAARDSKVGLEYHESPGDHEWGAWDREIQSVLEWLPMSR